MKPQLFTLLLILFTLNATATEKYPVPESWSFPQIIESARKISPNNIEGRPFNQFGLSYPREVLSDLEVSSMPATELQNYADIVAHAYPDAIGTQVPCNCSNQPIKEMNETTIAGIAYISLNAQNEEIRTCAKACLLIIQGTLQESK